jgi:lipopolysaccharide biosynthesis glycosyltransferase
MAYRITVIDGGLEPDQRTRLRSRLTELGEGTNTPVEVDFTDVSHPVFDRFPQRRGSRLTYARLALPFLFPQEDVVYVDSDTLCLRGLEAFAPRGEGADEVLWAARDPLLTCRRDSTLRRILPPPELAKPYFNAGIILFRCAEANRRGYADEIQRLLGRVQAPRFADQTIMNLLFRDHWREIPIDSNYVVTQARATEFLAAPRAVNLHYVGPRKPWMPEPSAFYRFAPDLLWYSLPVFPELATGSPTLDQASLRAARRKAILYLLTAPSRARRYRQGLRALDRLRTAGLESLALSIADHPETRPAVARTLRQGVRENAAAAAEG